MLLTMDPKELGRRIRAARAYAGISSADELAHETGMGVSTLLRIESGIREARPFELWAIARVCGVPEAWFFDEKLPQMPPEGRAE